MTETNLAVKKLKEKFPNSILEVTTFRGEITVTVSKGEILEICKFLHSDPDLQYHLAHRSLWSRLSFHKSLVLKWSIISAQ